MWVPHPWRCSRPGWMGPCAAWSGAWFSAWQPWEKLKRTSVPLQQNAEIQCSNKSYWKCIVSVLSSSGKADVCKYLWGQGGRFTLSEMSLLLWLDLTLTCRLTSAPDHRPASPSQTYLMIWTLCWHWLPCLFCLAALPCVGPDGSLVDWDSWCQLCHHTQLCHWESSWPLLPFTLATLPIHFVLSLKYACFVLHCWYSL